MLSVKKKKLHPKTAEQKGAANLIGAYRANQGKQKASAHTGSDVSDWHDETGGNTLLVCLMRERQVRLCHADWKIAKTLRGKTKDDLFKKGISTCDLHRFYTEMQLKTKGLTKLEKLRSGKLTCLV